MAQTYLSNRPPVARPTMLVTGISFGTSLLGAVLAGAAHPVAGLGVLTVGLLSALGIHHLLWLSDEAESAEMAPQPPVEVETTIPQGANVYPARRA
jgi:hypothetical protein